MSYFQWAADVVRASLIKRVRHSVPKAIAIPPSESFDGNDGPWSTFAIQVGTPRQDVRILVSTAGYQTWVVLPEGCTSTDPSNCATLRGGGFNPSESSTWEENTFGSNGTFTLELETNLGYSGNGDFGYDTITLGWEGSGGPSLDQQILAGIATKDFYLGIFGLNPKPSNFTNFDRPVPSFMTNLRDKLLIPSLSWGYTAGNLYRFNRVLGSLTLGGFDSSKFLPNGVSFPFSEIETRDLTVNLDGITMDFDNTTIPLLTNGISALIDSTVPYLYLPQDVCESFERAFGIEWSEDVQAYLINDTLHSTLKAKAPSTTFSLGNPSSENKVHISLPYEAFDLNAQYPLLLNTSSRYFPLMRASNDSQYTLGRTFLQEAYLIADCERQNFSVSQCDWNPNAQQDIVSIAPPGAQHYKHLAARDVVGIIIGATVGAVLLGVLGAYYFRKIRPVSCHTGRAKSGLDMKEEFRVKSLEEPQEIDGNLSHGAEVEGDRNFAQEIHTQQERLEMSAEPDFRHEMMA